MGCLLVLLASTVPRVVLVFMWVFGNMVDRAFSGFVLPLVGIIVAPYTTLFYVLAWSPVGAVSGWGYFTVCIGVLLDVGHWASAGLKAKQRY
jgi:hypothetical protein